MKCPEHCVCVTGDKNDLEINYVDNVTTILVHGTLNFKHMCISCQLFCVVVVCGKLVGT